MDCIGFCTKDPSPMIPHLDEIKDFGQFWFVTITPYGREVEPNVPQKGKVISSFISLSEKVGIKSVAWRYDPIFITEKYSIKQHIADFSAIAKRLSGHTEVCVISFIDLYEKVKRNFPEARTVSPRERAEIGEAFAKIGKEYGIKIKTCAEGTDLEKYGIDCSGCQTKETIENAIGARLKVPSSKRSPRAECSCLIGTDIGAYDTCAHLCRYCYANANKDNVVRNARLHDPSSPLLLGNLRGGEEIHSALQESWIDRQQTFL